MRCVLEAPFGHVRLSVDGAGRVVGVGLSEEPRSRDVPEGFPGRVVCAFEGYLEGRLGGVDVEVGSVDVSGFAGDVLEALGEVPCGDVVTYGGLAERVGSSGGARAVGQALASNPVPLVWPCHRVVSARGLGGFMGEKGRVGIKRWLLEHEGALGSVGGGWG